MLPPAARPLPPASRPLSASRIPSSPVLAPSTRCQNLLVWCMRSESGLRVNKCFKTSHSRRQADAVIAEGRVQINGRVQPNPIPLQQYISEVRTTNVRLKVVQVASAGDRVFPGDSVKLDGRHVKWQALNSTTGSSKERHVYIKYWKPRGVTCTTDRTIKGNVIDEIGKRERIFPVGRLDKDSTGLLLLTNDGRLVNSLLRSTHAHFKHYTVTVDKPLTADFVRSMRTGVTITTDSQRDGRKKTMTASTLPCRVKQVDERTFRIRLQEGRNRQIRKMCEVLGYEVLKLHRDEVAGITLKGLQEGRWKAVTGAELAVVQKVLS